MVICDICACDMHMDQVYQVYTKKSQGKLAEVCKNCHTILIKHELINKPITKEKDEN